MSKGDNPEPEKFTVWHGLLLAEFFAVAVALATTIVPGRTGSKYGIAGYFFDGPTFAEEFLVNLVLIHLMLVLLGLVAALWLWVSRSRT